MRADEASSRIITAREALDQLPESARERVATLFENESLQVKLYAPRGVDDQTPHTRDEIYVVLSGSGEFVCEEKRDPVKQHDFVFVRAGVPHRFENFTGDFFVWVFLYGAKKEI